MHLKGLLDRIGAVFNISMKSFRDRRLNLPSSDRSNRAITQMMDDHGVLAMFVPALVPTPLVTAFHESGSLTHDR
jgi:hypothetical protein